MKKWIQNILTRIERKKTIADTSITDLVYLLQATLNAYSKTHSGLRQVYYVRLAKNNPHKFNLIVYNDNGCMLFYYTIEEVLEALSYQPSICYKMLINKVLNEKKKI